MGYVPVHKALPGRPFSTLLRYNLPYWRLYVAGALLAVLYAGIELGAPMVIRDLVAQLNQGTVTYPVLFIFLALLLGIAIGAGLARYWQRTLLIGASRRFEFDLRNDYFRHVQMLSLEFFHRVKTGDVMARATNDMNYVRSFVGPGIMGTMDLLRVPFTLAMLLYLSPHLTIIALCPFPLVSVLVYFFVTYMHRQSNIVQEQFSVITSRAQENLAGARVVKAYGVADRELRDFAEDSRVYMRESFKLAAVMGLAWPMIGMVVSAIILLVIWRGGLMVINQSLAFEDLVAFLFFIALLAWPVANFGWVLTLYQRGAVSMNRISEILCEEPRIRDTEATRSDVPGIQGAIRFENVSFAYDGQVVLKDISFEVPAGKTIALVGPTGSGKSTVVALLTREYDAVGGRIMVDGVDIREIPVRTLKNAIGYVPQDNFLFSDTIRANLAFGKPEASEGELNEAVEAAQLAETIQALPEGLDTLLGERGINLSGGQKQRLSIARALLRDPAILILDDALSSVDTQTEELILERLKQVMSTRTSVIIAHRVSTVSHADFVLVIQDGEIVERGTHDELLARDGLYASMRQRQLLEEAIEKQA